MEASACDRREMYEDLHRSKAAEVKRATRRDRRLFYHGIAEKAEVEAHRGDKRTLFKLEKDLGGLRKSYFEDLKDSKGNKTASEQAKVARWQENFNNVLNCEEPMRIDMSAL